MLLAQERLTKLTAERDRLLNQAHYAQGQVDLMTALLAEQAAQPPMAAPSANGRAAYEPASSMEGAVS